jgi:predicted nucleic acid-binding protein
MSRIALDSNILVYLAGVSRTDEDDEKIDRTRSLVARLSDKASLIAPVQALGELFVVLRRAGTTAHDARRIVTEFAARLGTTASEARTVVAAVDLVVDHKLQLWDALILTASAEAECTLLLSEDMQHGFVVRGLTVINPLAPELHPKLKAFI